MVCCHAWNRPFNKNDSSLSGSEVCPNCTGGGRELYLHSDELRWFQNKRCPYWVWRLFAHTREIFAHQMKYIAWGKNQCLQSSVVLRPCRAVTSYYLKFVSLIFRQDNRTSSVAPRDFAPHQDYHFSFQRTIGGYLFRMMTEIGLDMRILEFH